MIRALYSAASGMTAQQLNVDNIANNLANASTTGYKMRRAHSRTCSIRACRNPALRRTADHRAHRLATRPRHARCVQ